MVSRTEYSSNRNRLDRLYEKSISLAEELEHDALARSLTDGRETFNEDQLRLVVCGEFKRGKSSLINALLDQPDLFPVDVDITTSVVTTIGYAEHERVELIRSDADGQPENVAISRAEIPDYVTEAANPRNRRQALLVSIQGPIEPLKAGLTIVDTPGVGGVNLEHSAITYSYIAKADVVLFVCHANSPMTVPEIEFVKRIHQNTSHILFAMTKIDQVDDYEAIIRSNQEKLADALAVAPSDIEIIPLSSSLKLAYLERNDPLDLEESNYPAFEDRLWGILREQRGEILLGRSAMQIRDAVEELRAPVQLALTAYDEHTQQELDEIEAQLNQSMAALQDVKANEGRWKKELNSEINDLRNQIGSSLLMKQKLRVRNEFQRNLESDETMENPEQIGSVVIGDLTMAAEMMNEALEERVGKIQARLVEQLDAQLGSALGARIAVDVNSPDLSHVSDIQKSSGISRSIDYGRHVSITGIGGAGLGGILAGVAGAVVGTLLLPGAGTIGGFFGGLKAGATAGTVFGTLYGAKRGFDELASADYQARRQKIRALLEPVIEETFIDIQTQLSQNLSRISDQIADDLQTALQRKIDALNDQINAFRDARKRTRQEAQLHAAAIRKNLGQLDEISRELDQIESAAQASLTTSPSPSPEHSDLQPAKAAATTEDLLDYGDWAEDDER